MVERRILAETIKVKRMGKGAHHEHQASATHSEKNLKLWGLAFYVELVSESIYLPKSGDKIIGNGSGNRGYTLEEESVSDLKTNNLQILPLQSLRSYREIRG